MKVYKFGGASVKDAAGVRNLRDIVLCEKGQLFVVVSAMGKMTNALEVILEAALRGATDVALQSFDDVKKYHDAIIDELFGADNRPDAIQALYHRAERTIKNIAGKDKFYDSAYDSLVGYGELISTTIIAEYLRSSGIATHWIDMQHALVTDNRFREANVDEELSGMRLKSEVEGSEAQVFVAQGFIGTTVSGEPTTLGREGSDYTASVVAYMLDAQSVTIWKDVPGVLNADPKIFPDAVMINCLTYLDAIELSYSGAQIIHPKTIKPLQNKDIPLYVRPFGDINGQGSVIKGTIEKQIDVPIMILKRKQVLVSIRPHDFSFVLAERLSEILSRFEQSKIKINLIQSSAVNLSLCVDDTRTLPSVVEGLKEHFTVKYNGDMELLTIRGYTAEQLEHHHSAPGVYVAQKTRRIMRIVRKSE